MHTNLFVTLVLGGAGLYLCVLLGQGLRILLYARSDRYRCHQRLRQIRR